MTDPDNKLNPILRVRRAQQGVEQRRTQDAAAKARACEARADELTTKIESLAKEMQLNKRPGRLDVKALQQMDELTELLRRQQSELREQAREANDLLEECHDELDRASLNVRTVERLKELQANERSRRDERRDAA